MADRISERVSLNSISIFTPFFGLYVILPAGRSKSKNLFPCWFASPKRYIACLLSSTYFVLVSTSLLLNSSFSFFSSSVSSLFFDGFLIALFRYDIVLKASFVPKVLCFKIDLFNETSVCLNRNSFLFSNKSSSSFLFFASIFDISSSISATLFSFFCFSVNALSKKDFTSEARLLASIVFIPNSFIAASSNTSFFASDVALLYRTRFA